MCASNKYSVFTVCNIAYMPKALVLGESLLKYHQIKLNIYIIDKKIDISFPDNIVNINWIEDVGVPDLYAQAFKYDITEFSTSLKPYITVMLLEKYEYIIYLDPDICIYNSLDPILDDLKKYSIIMTPHYTTPQSDLLPDSDIAMMRFGSFNLGFFAIRKSEQAISFLRWWNDRCRRFCYFETQFGLSTDQKWVSIAPCFFQDLHISFNLGYNVAFWNLHERNISKNSKGNYIINNNYPLIFFHFSSFDEINPDLLSQRYYYDKKKKRVDILELSLSYNESLKKYSKKFSAIKYGFDYMSNGEYISPTLRRAYACVVDEFTSDHNPFDSSGPVGSFAKRNNLIEKHSKQFKASSYDDIANHEIKFMIINFIMRCILRLLGPNKSSNFSRLLVYLSSFRQNRNLWKM
jgi:hypothetical protein